MGNNSNLNLLRSIPEFFGEVSHLCVVVPKIQRSYAQGRANELNLRTKFIDDIFSALEKNETIELSFVYGAKSTLTDNTFRFELLDGQQRLTTLILLYWYVASAENKEIPRFIKSFSYETRTTSSDFIEKLSQNTISFIDQKPSDAIKSRMWHTTSFDKDDSVNGMMNMLDTIHARYNESSLKGCCFDTLDNIKFYELDLEDFGLTEEIYVKMNARGLQLTPFENFKADLIKFLRREDMPMLQISVEMNIVGKPKVPYYLNFSQKLDNRWLNIFWNKSDGIGRDYCSRFFRFFYRFFSSKLFLEYQKDLGAQDFRPKAGNKLWDFFWQQSPEQNKTYLGFSQYNELLEKRPDYIKTIEKILDWFSLPNSISILKNIIPENFNSFFEHKYNLQDATIFMAICEYIERSDNVFDETNFRRWIRIVKNATNDQLFRNVNELISLSRNLIFLLDQPGAITNIYAAIANLNLPQNIARNIAESVYKAKIIIEHPDQNWENEFIKAEQHPFFNGSISFLLCNLPTSTEAFGNRAKIVGQLFDCNGIAEKGKENHRLIRSLIRQLHSREELLSTPATTLTERIDKDNHLRSLLLEKESISKFLCKLGDMDCVDTAYNYIDSIIDKDPVLDIDNSSLFKDGDPRLERAFRRICLDPTIYDYIAEKENGANRFFVFMQRDGNYTVDYRNSWHERIYIGTERSTAIRLLLDYGYEFAEVNAKQFYDRYNEIQDNEVWLIKELNEVGQIKLCSFHNGMIHLCFNSDNEALKAKLTKFKTETENNSIYDSTKEELSELEIIFTDLESVNDTDICFAKLKIESVSDLTNLISDLHSIETLLLK